MIHGAGGGIGPRRRALWAAGIPQTFGLDDDAPDGGHARADL